MCAYILIQVYLKRGFAPSFWTISDHYYVALTECSSALASSIQQKVGVTI